MNRHTVKISPKTLFLAILIVGAVLIISVTSICAVQLIKADKASEKAQLLDRAVIETTSIAETLKASEGQLDMAGQLMREHKLFEASENTLTFYYDKELSPSTQTDSPYRAHITKSHEGSCISYNISIKSSDGQGELYSLAFKTTVSGGDK